MSVYEDPKVDNLKKTLSILEDSNYYSILYVYHSTDPSNWIRAAHVLDKSQKIKHMIAIRPYAISPEYFVMMYDAFDEIAKDKIMFNIVPGRIQNVENVIENSLYIGDMIDDTSKRIAYSDKWLEKVLSIKKIPEIVISGMADDSLALAKKYGDYSAFTLDLYDNDRERANFNIKKMALVNFLIRDSNEQAEYETRNLPKHVKARTFYGTKEHVLERVKEIEASGITDIMVRRSENDKEYHRVHEFVKENSSN